VGVFVSYTVGRKTAELVDEVMCRIPLSRSIYSITFEELLFRPCGYSEIEQRLAVTWKNRDRLLQFLDHPFVSLHNNESEIAAREPVIE
jgi:hypothetical protein